MQNDFESKEQVRVIRWAKAHEVELPELELLHAVPNGGFRAISQAKKLKNEGVKAGVPDLHLPVPRDGYASLYIEMKIKGGRLTKAQLEWVEKLSAYRNKCVVCYSAAEAIKEIAIYLGVYESEKEIH